MDWPRTVVFRVCIRCSFIGSTFWSCRAPAGGHKREGVDGSDADSKPERGPQYFSSPNRTNCSTICDCVPRIKCIDGKKRS